MPLLTMIVPDEFKKQYPKLVDTLKRNEPRLVTLIDVYHTMQHILKLSTNNAQSKFS